MLPKSLNTQVEIVGDGGERKFLENLANELGIAKQVKFLGHISEEDLPKAYERATLFAMPSIAELQSIATMEAMASGRPVVAANAMALPHLVHNGDNGYLFEPDDVVEFSQKLKAILTADQTELDRLSENSLHLIQAHDIQRTLTIFEGLYRGDSDSDRTSDDNSADYSLPIGKLPESLHNRVEALRERARALRGSAQEVRVEVREKLDDLREEVKEKLEDVREEVREKLDDVREDVASRTRKAKSAVKKATERIKGDDD
jgi:gas vesicle protein